MASHRRPKQPTRARVTVVTATAAAAVALFSQNASAAPGKPSKDEVKSQVDALYEEAEQATEKSNGAKERQEALEKEIGQIQDQVARGQGELNDLRSTLGSMASAQYRNGGIDPALALLLSEDPDSYLDKASSLEHLSGKQVEAVQRIQAKQRTLAQQRQEPPASSPTSTRPARNSPRRRRSRTRSLPPRRPSSTASRRRSAPR